MPGKERFQRRSVLLLRVFLAASLLGHYGFIDPSQTAADALLLVYGRVEEDPVAKRILKREPKDERRLEWLKIDYLISRVRHSPYTFIRNQDSSNGHKAASYLRWKYARKMRKGYRPESAKGFIKKIASFSKTTGQPYLVRTSAGRTYLLKDVLLNELKLLEDALEVFWRRSRNSERMIEPVFHD